MSSSDYKKIEISVVTPAYKCAECVQELYERLTKVLSEITDSYEIIFVNDASPHNDWDIILKITGKDKKVKGINLSRNFGQHYAISAGLEYASGDWIVVMDCDLQDRPEEIGKLYKKALEGYDIVAGKRANRKDSFFKTTSAKLFHKIYSYLIEMESDGSVSNFGIYSKTVINEFNKMVDRNRNFTILIKWLGFKTAYIDIDHGQRYAGQTSYNFNQMLNFAIDCIVSQSNKPLRLSIKFGLLVSLISFIYGLSLIYKYFYHGIGVEGWTSMMVILLFISGLLFANMGLLGLYIGKIFDETKRRPIYVIKDVVNMDKEK